MLEKLLESSVEVIRWWDGMACRLHSDTSLLNVGYLYLFFPRLAELEQIERSFVCKKVCRYWAGAHGGW